MLSPLPRRTLTKGALWSVPALAVASSAPALEASSTCYVSEEDLNQGRFTGSALARSWQVVGARSYLQSFGNAAPAQTSNNFGLRSDCGFRGSVTFKIHNNSAESDIDAPPVTLADGTVFSGAATLGNVLSGGAKVGFDSSVNISWGKASTGSTKTANREKWRKAQVRIPMEFSYTAPDGSLHKTMLILVYTMMDEPWRGGARGMVDPHFEMPASGA